ncbi:toll-like receptor 18 [Chanos chanos]|uniref:Toll-like receptor 18 n=1 Tax=Chanos chanos TaxID=29144 RepID=A0A6J2W4I1_CHACN|nr:toll-like receptor 2 type-2 [Chanos chanos]
MAEKRQTLIALFSLLLSVHGFLFISPTDAKSPCHISDDQSIADCKGQRLDRVPISDLPASLTKVDLSYNILDGIYNLDFSHLPNLRVLLLQYNNISVIEDEAFKFNLLLEELNIFNNSLNAIPSKALAPLIKLKNLDMSNNLYSKATLDLEVFSAFTSLKVLSMGGPLVKTLRKGDLDALQSLSLNKFAIKTGTSLKQYEQGYLEHVQTENMWFDVAIDNHPHVLPQILQDLANKTFRVLRFRNLFEFTYYTSTEDLFSGLQYIRAHDLFFHRGKVNENLLRMLLLNIQVSPIKSLILMYIDFARSPTFVDNGKDSSVTDLALDRLVLSDISNPDILRFDWRFTWFNKIRHLIIWNVNFNSVPCDAWQEMGDVQTLDVSKNQLRSSYLYNQQCNYKGTMPSLHLFNLSNNFLNSLSDVASLTGEFKSLKIIDLSYNQLGSAEGDACTWKPNITHLLAHHNQIVTTSFKCLPTTLVFLDLSYCNLERVDKDYFEKASNLREVRLSGNKIKFIPAGWKNPNLQSLSLDGNSFGLINMGLFKDMPGLVTLKAGNNPYHCTCDLHNFIHETTSKGKVKIIDWPENYKCYHPEALLDTMVSKYFPGHVACDIRLVIIISVATTSVVVLAIMLVCYVFNIPWYAKASYQIIRAKYRAHKEGAGPSVHYAFHAFISYSHADADWVRDHLLTCLENARPPYRLCIHERDFMPGKWIIDNIIENIENSRKVIFVLSRHFVDSEWCNYELYFAQQRAIGKTFSDVILVVKEPIDPNSLPSKYCKLKKMLSTKTYLEWPQQPKQQPFFWAQLKSVLGKPNLVQRRSTSGRNRPSTGSAISVVELPPENQRTGDAVLKLEESAEVFQETSGEVETVPEASPQNHTPNISPAEMM